MHLSDCFEKKADEKVTFLAFIVESLRTARWWNGWRNYRANGSGGKSSTERTKI